MAIFFSNVKTRLLRGETARKDSSTGFFNILLETFLETLSERNKTEAVQNVGRESRRVGTTSCTKNFSYCSITSQFLYSISCFWTTSRRGISFLCASWLNFLAMFPAKLRLLKGVLRANRRAEYLMSNRCTDMRQIFERHFFSSLEIFSLVLSFSSRKKKEHS